MWQGQRARHHVRSHDPGLIVTKMCAAPEKGPSAMVPRGFILLLPPPSDHTPRRAMLRYVHPGRHRFACDPS